MSLYDDDDDVAVTAAAGAASITGWTKSVSWMQSQQKQSLVTKSKKNAAAAAAAAAAVAKPGSASTAAALTLPPVVNLQKTKKPPADFVDTAPRFSYGGDKVSFRECKDANIRGDKSLLPLNDPNWTVVNEYDPLWPNDYHKVVKEIREAKRGYGGGGDDEDSKKRRYSEAGRERIRERYHNSSNGRPGRGSDDEDEDDRRRRLRRERNAGSGGSGAAIAPPPSLTESAGDNNNDASPATSNVQKLASMPASTTGLGVAAKIMAKYGYKHGQGLGRDEQGMSMALSVEKTSKRGGRIVHEKDLLPPPPPPTMSAGPETAATPPHISTEDSVQQQQGPEKPSITDLMKNPSKVVLCKNMVGPGEVDDELEPEVKEECNSKYGDVNKVVIFELQNVAAEEAVRIFIEFKRVESAIKAVVDLNGRFFGGREVAAAFYDVDKFQNLQLTD